MGLIKTQAEIAGIRDACRIAHDVLVYLGSLVRPGLTTGELDRAADDAIRKRGARSAFLGYRDFPGQTCISVNDEVVHGIGGLRRLQFGDIVSLDVGVLFRGFVGDTAATYPVGGCDPAAQQLMDVTREALRLGIAAARGGNVVADISRAVQQYVEAAGFSVVREFVGHGVGRSVHEEPQVPNFVEGRGRSPRLQPGMTIAIEPMVNAGTFRVMTAADRWTIVTQDGKPSAHFEYTVLVGKSKAEVLTVYH